ncbi:ParB/RepB/Spo0J family partition protein [Methylobacterium oryzisoli]|uniref:ParB/RepB/Spo0J family partition protein n=1 Tax=Methylobacterium oryzisoli TaxID=3385502 RepID=UPI0038926F28
MQSQDLPITHIFVRQDARKIDEAAVRGLMESIREVGIINPLRVRPARRHVEGIETDAYEVTAGAHRLRAARKLGMEAVPCIVADDDDLRAELAMIDENLMRAELSPALRAQQTARRKAIYEELHPGTGHGSPGVSRQVGDIRDRSDADRFTAETAGVTGRSERAIQRDAERGDKISERALQLVAGTHLDTGTFLDKIKSLGEREQEARVQRELAAPRKPVSPAPEPRNEIEAYEAWLTKVVRLFDQVPDEWRERARDHLFPDVPVMDRGRA